MPGDPFYWSKPWRALRARTLANNQVCACGGRTSRVDHIQTRRQAPSRELDPTNLIAMCEPCHNAKTARHDGGFGNQVRMRGCDASGRPLDPNHHWNRR